MEPKKRAPMSAETRAKISAAKKGKPNPHKGRPKTEDEKRRISESLRGRERSPEHRANLAKAMTGKVSPLRGIPRDEATRQKISDTLSGRELTTEQRTAIGDTLRAKGLGDGHYLHRGYRVLTKEYDHPLASKGLVAEHRKVLFDSVGPDDQPCHWCGVMVTWGSTLCTDHLDWERTNNDPANLVASCWPCNSGRKRKKD